MVRVATVVAVVLLFFILAFTIPFSIDSGGEGVDVSLGNRGAKLDTSFVSQGSPESLSIIRTHLQDPVSDDWSETLHLGESMDEGVLVTVLDAESGNPISNATVLYLEVSPPEIEDFFFRLLRSSNQKELFAAEGLAYKADIDGQVIVPFTENYLWIAAYTATSFDIFPYVNVSQDNCELELGQVVQMRIRVVSDEGEPVAYARVGLREEKGDSTIDILPALTGEDGWAEIQLCEYMKVRVLRNRANVAYLNLSSKQVSQEVDLSNIPPEGVVLTVPVHGTVKIEILNADGEPYLDPTVVSAHFSASPDQSVLLNGASNPIWQSITSNGVLVLSAVDFNQSILVHAEDLNGIMEATTQVAPLTADNPLAFARLTLEEQGVIITGRLLDEMGKLFANKTLISNVEGIYGQRRTDNHMVTTDDKGIFRLRLDIPNRDQDVAPKLTLRFVATPEIPEHDAVLYLNSHYPQGVTSLGDIALSVVPVAASGVVYQPSGIPLIGAELSLEKGTPDINNPRKNVWNPQFVSRTKSRLDGSFVIGGRYEPGEYRLVVKNNKYPTVVRTVNLGEEGLEIVMPLSGGISGKFRFDDQLPVEGLEIVLAMHPNEETAVNHFVSSWVEIQHDGSFLRTGLPEGTVDLTLRCIATEEVLFCIEGIGIDVREDKPQDLGEIDLRGILHDFTIRFAGPENQRVKNVRLSSVRENHIAIVEGMSILIVTAQSSKDFFAWGDGYQQAELIDISDDTVVHLQPCYQVRIRIANPGIIPSGEVPSLGLIWNPGARLRLNYNPGLEEPLNEHYERLFSVQDTGEYLVICLLNQSETMPQSQRVPGLVDIESMRIRVEDIGGEQFFEVHLSEEIFAFIMQSRKMAVHH